jgi:hypothetical protein
MTLNLLRGSCLNPKLSAWAQVHGAFNFDRTPLAPPSIRILVHEKPSIRATWSTHAVNGWYIGPAEHHYRCYRVWVQDTRAECIANTLKWFPSTNQWWLYANDIRTDNYALRTITSKEVCCKGADTSEDYVNMAKSYLSRRFTFVIDQDCFGASLEVLSSILSASMRLRLPTSEKYRQRTA